MVEEEKILQLHLGVVVEETFQEEVASEPLHLHTAALLQIGAEEVAAFLEGEGEEEENQKEEEEDTFQEEDQEVVSPPPPQLLDAQLLPFPLQLPVSLVVQLRRVLQLRLVQQQHVVLPWLFLPLLVVQLLVSP